jgi:Flp pilus assembly protein TadD
MAVQLRPAEVQFHLNLGEVYALAGRREKALDFLDDAVKLFGKDARLRQARSKVQKRRNPLVPFIGREHLLNSELGRLRQRKLKRLGKDGV